VKIGIDKATSKYWLVEQDKPLNNLANIEGGETLSAGSAKISINAAIQSHHR